MQLAADLPDLCGSLARSVVGALHADACVVSLLDDSAANLFEVAAFVNPPSSLPSLSEGLELSGYPFVARVLWEQRPLGISVRDEEASSERRLLERGGFGYVLLCPLTVDGDAVGLIEIFRVQDRPFRQDDPSQVALLSTFAANAYSRIKMAQRLDSHYMETIAALAAALEARDPDTREHTTRMRDLASALADAMSLSPEDRRAVKLGSVLHDVGKIGIPDSVLRKPGPLTDEEWSVMRKHPEIGESMLKDIAFLSPVLPAVRHHHERWDGGGYPDGLTREDIPVTARVITVCDSFDAMTSDRPYRRAMRFQDAVAELKKNSGTQFDPDCVELFLRIVDEVGPDDLAGRVVRFAS
jgi:putative nucleotidyltransferase with HDIG domain